MPNRLLLNDLLYVTEHLTCNNYKRNVDLGFVYKEFEPGDVLTDECVIHNHLIALLEGSFTAGYHQHDSTDFKSGQMIIVPRGATFNLVIHEKVKLLAMSFDKPISGCDRLVISELHKYGKSDGKILHPLDIRHPLDDFFKLIVFCLRERISCAHFHELKHKELFIYLKGFYTKEELAGFFNPILSKEFNFRDFIFQNCDDVSSVEELIIKSNMTARTFQRHFLDEFGMTAKSWLNKRIANRIIAEASNPEATIKDIMFKFGFDTPSNFTRFCKSQLNCTPSELLQKSRNQNWQCPID